MQLVELNVVPSHLVEAAPEFYRYKRLVSRYHKFSLVKAQNRLKVNVDVQGMKTR